VWALRLPDLKEAPVDRHVAVVKDCLGAAGHFKTKIYSNLIF